MMITEVSTLYLLIKIAVVKVVHGSFVYYLENCNNKRKEKICRFQN